MLKTLLRALCIALLGSGLACAEDSGRWYLGLGAGHVHSMDYCGPYFDTVVLACDNTAIGFKVFGGVNISPYFALEAGYADLGKLRSDLQILGLAVHDESRARGATLQALGRLPLAAGFSLLAKAGGIYWTLKQEFSVAGIPASQSTSGVDLLLGVGGEYQFTRSLALRLEYEYFPNLGKASETGDTDINFYSLSAVLRF